MSLRFRLQPIFIKIAFIRAEHLDRWHYDHATMTIVLITVTPNYNMYMYVSWSFRVNISIHFNTYVVFMRHVLGFSSSTLLMLFY